MKKLRWVNWLALGTFCVQTVVTPLVEAEGWLRPRPPLNTVQQLARQIDCVEKTIDEYGSVVVKTPDVWGQARLTKYRVEYEEEMAKEKSLFAETINAAITRSDQAFLTSALSLQAAISGEAATVTTPPTNSPTSTKVVTTMVEGSPKKVEQTDTSTGSDTPTVEKLDAPKAAEDPLKTTSFTTTSKLVREDDLLGFSGKVALEPTLKLDQKSRYLQHLHQLRRINDGDDSADSPGYALHLVRIPVSVLPGKKTREGYGAEVTITAKPHLHDKLLPQTVRSLVINDLVDQFSFPLAKFLDSKDSVDVLKQFRDSQTTVGILAELQVRMKDVVAAAEQGDVESPAFLDGQARIIEICNQLIRQYGRASEPSQRIAKSAVVIREAILELTRDASDDQVIDEQTPNKAYQRETYNMARETISNVIDAEDSSPSVTKLFESMKASGTLLPSISATSSRRAAMSFPNTQAFDTFGHRELGHIAVVASALKNDKQNGTSTVLLDMQKFMAEEFNAAYDFLNHCPELWHHASSELSTAVRTKDHVRLKELRDAFLTCTPDYENLDSQQRHTPPLAWAIIVESALLNERLVEDIQTLASAKNAYGLTGEGLTFIGGSPDPMACEAFNQYVACRWPVHVFAIDPVAQDQNVADSFSLRREMQLALSLAFTSGRIGAQNFTRMARRIELDMETIALNRTVVGFSHGDDTFGWRFTPRIQSPDTKGTIGTFAELICKGGPSRDAMLNQHRLEPGMRECTALVLMPAFVPYVIFDTRTNWFKLTNPTRKELDLEDGVGLSSEITCLRQLSTQCTRDAHCFRPDEVYRLTRAVEQLERRLPLQTSYVQMPFEANLGGFEFFSTGTGDLAPELKGFYGEKGIVVDGNGANKSTIFLLGDHFSVHETRVVVGNREIPAADRQLLSRQVMQLTVPGNAVPQEDGTLDCHVATPYGISNHLSIPVSNSSADAAKAVAAHVADLHTENLTWETAEIEARLYLNDSRRPWEVIQINDTVVKHASSSPFPLEPAKVQVRGFILGQVKGQPLDTTKPLGQIQLELAFDKGKSELKIRKPNDIAANFETALLKALQTKALPANLETIEIQAYAKFYDQNDKLDAQPAIRFGNRLKIKLELCKSNCPTPCPPVPQTSFDVNPFDSAVSTEEVEPEVQVNPRSTALRSLPPQKWAGGVPRVRGSRPVRQVSATLVESSDVPQ